MFERIHASFALAVSSWRVLHNNKRLIIFPILSGIACLFVLASFLTPLVVFQEEVQKLNDNNQSWVFFVIGFAFYFCNYFVIIFFNAALISCALRSFQGENPTLGDGLRAAWSQLPQILGWALVSATVGMLLRGIEACHEKAGQFISSILGSIWTVMTYFVVPVIVVEKLGPFGALTRSLSIIKRTWGETLVGKLGLGVFLFLLALPGIALLVIGALLLQTVPAVGIAVMVVGGIYLLIDMAVSAALDSIFISALYRYASQNEVPAGFDSAMMRQAVRTS